MFCPLGPREAITPIGAQAKRTFSKDNAPALCVTLNTATFEWKVEGRWSLEYRYREWSGHLGGGARHTTNRRRRIPSVHVKRHACALTWC